MKKHILTACALAVSSLLSAQTYQVVVTTTDGTKHAYSTDQVSKMEFEEAPQYITANEYLGGRYEPLSGSARYTLTVATALPDAGGDPAAIGDMQLTVALVGALSDEAHKAILPDGVYEPSATIQPGVWDLSRSGMWVRIADGADGVENDFFVSGTADVRHTDGGKYDVRIQGTTLSGLQVAVRYEGTMTFTPGSGAAGDFDADQNITFDGAQGRYWANWYIPFADDMAAQLYTGTFDENNKQVEGYWLNIDMYLPKHENPEQWNVRLDDGVYTIDSREEIYDELYRPLTFRPGEMIDFFGSEYVTGTYLRYTKADGQVSQALITGGQFTVSGNGTSIEFDFTASNGIHITGSYNGVPYIVNYCDNSGDPGVPDTLRGDHVLNFISGTIAMDYNLGEAFIPGLYSHILMFTEPNMEHGDYIQMDILNSEEHLADGVYNFDDSLTDFSGLKGRVDFGGGLVFSWYGDLDSTDAEGYQDTLSPIGGGTMTLSTLSDGNRKAVFNLVSRDGHKITGEWTGPFVYASDEDEYAAKTMRRSQKLNTGIHPSLQPMHAKRSAVKSDNVRMR